MIKIVEEKVSQVFQKNGFKPWVCNMNQWKKNVLSNENKDH
jgi:hypothetical protein